MTQTAPTHETPISTDTATATDNAASADERSVIVTREGTITRVLLNRPRVLNALNMSMFVALSEALAAAAHDGTTAVLLQGAGHRGLSGGGDVKFLASCGVDAGIDVLRHEYVLDHAISVSPVPLIAIMDGVTMGGGIGLSGHAAFRIVTERSKLAMPEVRIGITPDIGGNHLLVRAPGYLGEYLAATADTMNAGDAIALGFADHYVPSDRIDALAELLIAGEAPEAAIAQLAEAAPESPMIAMRTWWDPLVETVLVDADRVFADPVTATTEMLAALEDSGHTEAIAAAATVRTMNPASVAIAIAQLARVRGQQLTLAEVLRDDLRILGRTCDLPNFIEGVRAQMIDKDGAPQWSPARVEDLDRAHIAAILDPVFLPGEVPLEVA